ncbi:hypothetical protein SARC_04682 [Sphaeroforma arctica JP610]|uniref:Uncharacterized protein n=1 Tax=Sphaeroforma arctica JP610 TaxID=667725 RepID=A0A0L0G2L4_9EUKA|nr:hypothetical protein SARC_04682 [Sphaeroforma arctica JP610]KNC83064.1 hypothetical protein SARC_04682 [Sphaeroforma arctica JP610]|eukprot:XP_014156966.1 hypothetical protein SARC_04682 [Sphaeroforma arctica JP610]
MNIDSCSEWRNIERCPPVIETNTSDNTELSQVHVVGDRTASGTFFCAKDIATLVDVSKSCKVYNTITNDNRVKIRIKGTLAVYLDTFGFIIYILSTKRGQSTGYAKWAMGLVAAYTTHDTAKIIELSAPSLQISLRRNNVDSPIPGGVYLIYAGTVGELKGLCDTLPLDVKDDHRIYKFGRSDNLHRRLGEHEHGFPGSTLAFAVYICSGTIGDAEAAIADIVSKHSATSKFPLKKQREVFCVPATMADALVDQLYNECRAFGAKSVSVDKLVAEKAMIQRDLKAVEDRALLTEQANHQVTEANRLTMESLNNAIANARRAYDEMRVAYFELAKKYDDARDRLMDFALLAPSSKKHKPNPPQ